MTPCVLQRLDPNATPITLNNILKQASYLKSSGSLLAGSQGKAEGDVLENVVNALGDLLLGTKNTTRLKGSPDGNTWYETDDKKLTNGYTGRDTFYAKLKDITDSDAYKAFLTLAKDKHLTLKVSNAITAAVAKDDFSSFAALASLSPFVLSVDEANRATLEATLGAAWGNLYTDWKRDKALSANDRAAGQEIYTAQYLLSA